MAITKNDILQQVHKLGFSRKASSDIIEALLEIIKSRLESGEDVLVSNFGKFCVKEKAPRRGRNPATGEDLVLDARRVVTFKSHIHGAFGIFQGRDLIPVTLRFNAFEPGG